MIMCYVMWGNRIDYRYETIFSVLTFLEDPSIDEIVIVTDRPDLFAVLEGRVTLPPVSSEEFDAWGGPKAFQFRKKIKGIERVIDLYPDHDILFIDTDTFRGKPMRDVADWLGEGKVCMGDSSGYLSKAKDRNNRVLYSQVKGKTFAGYTVDEKTIRLNSGTAGFPKAKAKAIIQDTLVICDELYELTGYYGTEEIAISFGLGKYGPVIDAGTYVGHYYGNKAPWGNAIKDFLVGCFARKLSVDEMVVSVKEFDFKAIPTYAHTPRRRKQLHKIADKYWPLCRKRFYPEQPTPWW